jgi:ABC-type dipeptide/oligopeptide/nickel transport system permease subunit
VSPGLRRLLRELRANLLAQGACAVVLVLVVLAVFGSWIAPHDPEKFSLRERNAPPVFLEGGSWTYPLGTDPHGRDILSRIIHGTRVSLLTATSGVAIAVVLGLVLGMTAGYFGGVWDSVVMRCIDVLLSIPLVLMALLVVAVLGPAIVNIVLVMGGVGWIWHARIVRGNVLRIREEQYVLAAVNAGTPPSRILVRHVLPNLAAPVIVTATMQIGYMVILESGLSFFGITGTTLSWGWDIAFGRKYLGTAWWIASFPGLAIFVTVISLNVVGDFLRDVIDPHGKERPLG